MIRHDTYIHKYDWSATLFYNAKPRDTSYIMRVLHHNGLNATDYYNAQRLLNSGRPNEGLTYNNPRRRTSVVVIGHVSDVWELIDSIEHEGRHLIQGICKASGINPDGEEAAYLEGRLFKQIIKELTLNLSI